MWIQAPCPWPGRLVRVRGQHTPGADDPWPLLHSPAAALCPLMRSPQCRTAPYARCGQVNASICYGSQPFLHCTSALGVRLPQPPHGEEFCPGGPLGMVSFLMNNHSPGPPHAHPPCPPSSSTATAPPHSSSVTPPGEAPPHCPYARDRHTAWLSASLIAATLC